jgi:hypothetical protein
MLASATENAGENRRKELPHQLDTTSGGHGTLRRAFSPCHAAFELTSESRARQRFSNLPLILASSGCCALFSAQFQHTFLDWRFREVWHEVTP